MTQNAWKIPTAEVCEICQRHADWRFELFLGGKGKIDLFTELVYGESFSLI